MAIELKVPTIGESINEVTLSKWLVKDGDYVETDQSLCEFDSDKATLEFPAEKSGVITIKAEEGSELKIGAVIATLDTSAKAPAKKQEVTKLEKTSSKQEAIQPEKKPATIEKAIEKTAEKPAVHITPLAETIAKENKVDIANLIGTGIGGRITKEDVLQALNNGMHPKEIAQSMKRNSRDEHTEKVSRLRKTIASRLVSVKNEAAILTTFNEADMSAVMAIREKYKSAFEKQHGIGLGFMSFFVKACCNALLEFPMVNAYWNEDQILHHAYCDISIAVSTPKGLVVPVIRNAESKSMAEVELTIKDLAVKGRDGTLTLEEMQGGTFTITNGGVFGSMMSTPIINAPQSAILGMHKIQERPVAINGQVVIRPMMYLALSYDHRIIDGKNSVSFLVRVKEQLENPEQLIFGADPIKLLLDI
ncbi:MAG: 2-oxoglutarate dehydrogenase complex dihydrolipoyllysine-residue succinyltransferase [Bacteroidetes bacterium]|nr:2-oxoglutarate dehydrogenase complex dihydrolipoyllysine-residue succinyltransferase [Bacteroidota bacterium]MBP8753518.1 2-oxoglutarate dehydrogenase complex dihydrolipoyllysine-residue succinyltransferase [Chitinophagales bacterium]MBK7108515.1 2-oxoglutarate dehydrogenase complex dihydrolipoyllysine-residue succinyltransferase [Bacteroidota bacterium]MBK8489162.1 2-oxoglutarate dehydrogenase complex dihydrolipoyllysine-residue succinyltransferase [Bacteroidota bacterium]MBK8681011.1 2-oxo